MAPSRRPRDPRERSIPAVPLAALVLALLSAIAGCRRSASDLCEDLQKAKVALTCLVESPGSPVPLAKERVVFELAERTGRTGQLFRLSNDGDYEAARAGLTAAKRPHVYYIPGRRIVLVLDDDVPDDIAARVAERLK
jgi:hypothetical protein